MTLYLKQFYESPMGLLSIIVSEEGLVELDFYDPKEEAPDSLWGAGADPSLP